MKKGRTIAMSRALTRGAKRLSIFISISLF
jgi:hypothetical protein